MEEEYAEDMKWWYVKRDVTTGETVDDTRVAMTMENAMIRNWNLAACCAPWLWERLSCEG